MHVRAGRVVAVDRAKDDASVGAFLVRAGHVSVCPDTDDLDALVAAGVPRDRVARARRATWVDRLVAGLAAIDRGAPLVEARATVEVDDDGEELVTLVLDALARRAAESDAGVVGGRANERVHVHVELPEADVARAWAGLEALDLQQPLARLLVRAPGAATRIAALVRAGLAALVAPGEPPPPVRRGSYLPPARTSLVPSPAPSWMPARGPLVELTPGTGRLEDQPLAATLRSWPEERGAWDDPLARAEARLHRLEQVGAPGPERAEAWREVARLWQENHGSLEEACRAQREAAAADPTDTAALREAAALCAATHRLELAAAYAAAASAAASRRERASAKAEEAQLARRRGDVDAARRLTREALASDPSPSLRVRLVRDLEPYTPTYRDAVLALRSVDAARARHLLARLAETGDLGDLRAHAGALAEDGLAESAVSRLARRAQESAGDEARLVRLLAAEVAEDAQRPDLAFEQLVAAHVAEPQLDALLEPLVGDAEAAGWPETVAVWLERFASLRDDERAWWLRRAARAFRDLPGARAWSAELLVRALRLAHDDEALADLRAYAEELRDVAFLADALERIARRDDPTTLPLLEELAALSEERLGSAQRAAHAWGEILARSPEHPRAANEVARLHERTRIKAALVDLAHDDLARDPSPANARKLASMLRDHPRDRPRAIELYERALADDPDAGAFASLERLLRLAEDDAGLARLLERRTRTDGVPRDHAVRALGTLAGLYALSGELAASADAALRWLELAPQSADAVARLELAARFEPSYRDAADRARLALPVGRRHARVHARRIADPRLPPAEARFAFAAALDADPRASDACYALIARHDPPSTDLLAALERCREVLGDDAWLLRRLVEACGHVAPERRHAWLATWTGLDPEDRLLAASRLRAALVDGDPSTLRAAAEHVLRLGDASLLDDLRDAAERLAENADSDGAHDAAASLLLHTLDRLGGGKEIVDAAARHARSTDTRVAVAERRVAWSDEGSDVRIEALRELAHLHSERSARGAEARAWVRLLGEDPHDPEALARLACLYAEARDVERWLAVLALAREAAEDDPPTRRAHTRELVAVAWRHGDRDRARDYLRELVAEHESTVAGHLDAASVLVALGASREAIDLLVASSEESPPSASTLLARAVAILEREANDAEGALELAARTLSEGRRSPELLLAFERLALDRNAVALARRTYDALTARAMGAHGRRGTRYREARWLERAGQDELALEAFLEAFRANPAEGAVFLALERLARRTYRYEPLAEALGALAERQTLVERRLLLEEMLVDLLENDLGRPLDAFERLSRVWSETGRIALVPELRRLAKRVAIVDPARGIDALDRIERGLRDRIEGTWDVEDQVRTLTLLASFLADDRGDVSSAERLVATEVVRRGDDPEVPRELLAEAYVTMAERLLDAMRRPEARTWLERARELTPNAPRITRIDERLRRTPSLAPPTDAMASVEGVESVDAPTADSLGLHSVLREDRTSRPSVRPPEVANEPPEPVDRAPIDELTSSESPSAPSETTPSETTPSEDAARGASLSEDTTSETPSTDAVTESVVSEAPARDSSIGSRIAEAIASESSAHAEPRALTHDASAPGEPRSADADATPHFPDHTRRRWSSAPPPVSSENVHDAAHEDRELPTTVEPLAEATQPLSLRTVGSTPAARWQVASPPDDRERALRLAAAEDDVDDLLALASYLASNDRAREAVSVVLRAVRVDPARVDAVRTLGELAGATGALAIADVVSDLRAIFEGTPEPEVTSSWAHFLHPDDDPTPRATPTERALALLWSSAPTLLRRDVAELGVLGTRRVAPTSPLPLGRALARAQRWTQLADVWLYHEPAIEHPRWFPSDPPSVVVGDSFVSDEEGLRFRLTRAVSLARPAHVLLVASADPRAKLDGLRAAFGPPDGAPSGEAAAFAADLWRVVPARAQSALREMLRDGVASYESAREHAEAQAAAHGLLADGSLARCVRALRRDDATLRDLPIGRDADYVRAVRASAPLATMIRVALADASLAARARWLRESSRVS